MGKRPSQKLDFVSQHGVAVFREKLIQDKNARTIVLRALSVSEAEALLDFKRQIAIESDFLLSTPEIYKNRTQEQEEKWIEKLNFNPRSYLMALDFEGKLIGLLDFHAFSDPRRIHRGVLGLSILKSWRGFGLGKKLMNSFFELVSSHSTIEFVELAVMSENKEALRLYESLGFQEVYRLPGAFQIANQRIDEIYMRRENLRHIKTF